MCGIVAAVAQRDVAPILIAGLKALEYRGYDSAGLAILDHGAIERVRAKGKVREMEARYTAKPLPGGVGIAHTRWATHGVPSEHNAHPHIAGRVAIVHNGIIENHEALRAELAAAGRVFESETDTEVVAHLVDRELEKGKSLKEAVATTVAKLHGAYALAVMDRDTPGQIIGVRCGAPLVVGVGIGEHFLASDVQALLQVTRKVVYLEEGDLVVVERQSLRVFAADGQVVNRPVMESDLSADAVERGEYRHYMLKEIFEQPLAIANTLEGRLGSQGPLPHIFGVEAETCLEDIQHVHIIACGTSYHAGLVARYWMEQLLSMPVSVEVASEYRYRHVSVPPKTLFVAISQSGETADTLAALRIAEQRGYVASLAICNVPESSLVREARLSLLTRAGPEIGVASTKAFTTQLAALALLTLELGKRHDLPVSELQELTAQLAGIPRALEKALQQERAIATAAESIMHRQHALFLGRGSQYPVALEGALKLKEISYIHAEAYPAGELKHGPLALVDENMPVIAVAPNNDVLEKLKSNLQEVRARGGKLLVFAETSSHFELDKDAGEVIAIDAHGIFMAPLVFTVSLQLLAYHVAVLRGTDVDQPRNLAKSVTVE